jgi:hypothetical protein
MNGIADFLQNIFWCYYDMGLAILFLTLVIALSHSDIYEYYKLQRSRR